MKVIWFMLKCRCRATEKRPQQSYCEHKCADNVPSNSHSNSQISNINGWLRPIRLMCWFSCVSRTCFSWNPQPARREHSTFLGWMKMPKMFPFFFDFIVWSAYVLIRTWSTLCCWLWVWQFRRQTYKAFEQPSRSSVLQFASSAVPQMQRSHLFAPRRSNLNSVAHYGSFATHTLSVLGYDITIPCYMENTKYIYLSPLHTSDTRIKLIFSLMRNPDAANTGETCRGVFRRVDEMVLRKQNVFFVHFIGIALK